MTGKRKLKEWGWDSGIIAAAPRKKLCKNVNHLDLGDLIEKEVIVFIGKDLSEEEQVCNLFVEEVKSFDWNSFERPILQAVASRATEEEITVCKHKKGEKTWSPNGVWTVIRSLIHTIRSVRLLYGRYLQAPPEIQQTVSFRRGLGLSDARDKTVGAAFYDPSRALRNSQETWSFFKRVQETRGSEESLGILEVMADFDSSHTPTWLAEDSAPFYLEALLNTGAFQVEIASRYKKNPYDLALELGLSRADFMKLIQALSGPKQGGKIETPNYKPRPKQAVLIEQSTDRNCEPLNTPGLIRELHSNLFDHFCFLSDKWDDQKESKSQFLAKAKQKELPIFTTKQGDPDRRTDQQFFISVDPMEDWPVNLVLGRLPDSLCRLPFYDKIEESLRKFTPGLQQLSKQVQEFEGKYGPARGLIFIELTKGQSGILKRKKEGSCNPRLVLLCQLLFSKYQFLFREVSSSRDLKLFQKFSIRKQINFVTCRPDFENQEDPVVLNGVDLVSGFLSLGRDWMRQLPSSGSTVKCVLRSQFPSRTAERLGFEQNIYGTSREYEETCLRVSMAKHLKDTFCCVHCYYHTEGSLSLRRLSDLEPFRTDEEGVCLGLSRPFAHWEANLFPDKTRALEQSCVVFQDALCSEIKKCPEPFWENRSESTQNDTIVVCDGPTTDKHHRLMECFRIHSAQILYLFPPSEAKDQGKKLHNLDMETWLQGCIFLQKFLFQADSVGVLPRRLLLLGDIAKTLPLRPWAVDNKQRGKLPAGTLSVARHSFIQYLNEVERAEPFFQICECVREATAILPSNRVEGAQTWTPTVHIKLEVSADTQHALLFHQTIERLLLVDGLEDGSPCMLCYDSSPEQRVPLSKLCEQFMRQSWKKTVNGVRMGCQYFQSVIRCAVKYYVCCRVVEQQLPLRGIEHHIMQTQFYWTDADQLGRHGRPLSSWFENLKSEIREFLVRLKDSAGGLTGSYEKLPCPSTLLLLNQVHKTTIVKRDVQKWSAPDFPSLPHGKEIFADPLDKKTNTSFECGRIEDVVLDRLWSERKQDFSTYNRRASHVLFALLCHGRHKKLIR